MDRNQKINLFTALVLIGFLSAVVYHYQQGVVNGLGYPYNTFLFNPGDRFMDFFSTRQVGFIANSCYPPLSVAVIFLFSHIANANFSFCVYITLTTLFALWYCWENSKGEKPMDNILVVLIIGLLTFPFVHMLDRGNFESFVYISLALFFYFHTKRRTWPSIISLAFASALKIFPLAFILIFIAEKKYKEAFYTVVTTIVLTIVSGYTYSSSLLSGISQMVNNQKSYTAAYVIGDAGLDFGNSLFGLIKEGINKFNLKIDVVDVSRPYMIFVIVAILLFSVYIVFVEKTLWKKAALLAILVNLLPQVSPDYKLIHFLIPVFLFFNSKVRDKYDYVFLVLLALILIPKNYHLFGNFYDGVILDPLLMIALASMIIFSNYHQRSIDRKTL